MTSTSPTAERQRLYTDQGLALLNAAEDDISEAPDPKLGIALQLRNTKNSVDRTVYTQREVVDGLWLEQHSQRLKTDVSPLVFPDKKFLIAEKKDQFYVKRPIKIDDSLTRAKAGLDNYDARYGERLSIHHIRHTWATNVGDRRASLAQLMAIGGWETEKMPMRYMKFKRPQSESAALLLVDKDE